MKKVSLFILFLVLNTLGAQAATTYYAVATGNWSGTTTWSLSSGGATQTSFPVAGDTAIFDNNTGVHTVSLTGAAACATLTMTGSTGTLALGINGLTVSGLATLAGAMSGTGAITVSGGVTLSASPTGSLPPIILSGSQTWTSGGFNYSGIVNTNAANDTITMIGNFSVGTFKYTPSVTTIFSGAYNLIINSFIPSAVSQASAPTIEIPSGQTVTVNTLLELSQGKGSAYVLTFRAVTASSSMFLDYTGTGANQILSNVTFTDVDASGSNQTLFNFNGGTLLRTKNIVNFNAAILNQGGVE